MSYESLRRSGSTAGGGATGQAQGAVGKRSLVEQVYGEDAFEAHTTSSTPTEAGGSSVLSSLRFNEDVELVAVAEGKKTLASGTSGIHITKVQRALVEIGFANPASGTIDAATVTAVKAFQNGKTTQNGTIDKPTMLALDHAFSGYGAEGAVLKGIKPSSKPTEGKPYALGTAPKELLDGTHTPTATERDAFNDAISTEVKVDPKTGVLPTFTETIAGKKYSDELATAINAIVDQQLVRSKQMDTDRSAGHLYDWKDIEAVGVLSKNATDASFGAYATGKALKATGVDAKIKDAWEFKENQFKADPAEEDRAASWRVRKILTGHATIAAIDTAHGAIQTRAAEAAIVKKVHDDIVKARKPDLLLIHKAWPAFADGGDVFIQRVQHYDKGALDKTEGRSYMWKQFQTIIHEYIHTLEHPEHVKYRETINETKGGFTLREGTTDYFTKIAYNNTDRSDATLRKGVEGPFHDPKVAQKIPDLTTYRQSANAERAAGVVGLKNMCAGFFLGRVDLIGKK